MLYSPPCTATSKACSLGLSTGFSGADNEGFIPLDHGSLHYSTLLEARSRKNPTSLFLSTSSTSNRELRYRILFSALRYTFYNYPHSFSHTRTILTGSIESSSSQNTPLSAPYLIAPRAPIRCTTSIHTFNPLYRVYLTRTPPLRTADFQRLDRQVKLRSGLLGARPLHDFVLYFMVP
jgi:hypothetical protein